MNVVITLLDAQGEPSERVPVDCRPLGVEDGVDMWEVIWPRARGRLVSGEFRVSVDELPGKTGLAIPATPPH